MGDNPFFTRVYKSQTNQEVLAIYDDWAEEYDETVLSHGYITPQRCAAALAGLAPDLTAPVLDIGCGTGISGMALEAAGFTHVTGSEVNAAMLEKARARGSIYQNLMLVDVDNPFDFDVGTYRYITAMGVIATGMRRRQQSKMCWPSLRPAACLFSRSMIIRWKHRLILKPSIKLSMTDAPHACLMNMANTCRRSASRRG